MLWQPLQNGLSSEYLDNKNQEIQAGGRIASLSEKDGGCWAVELMLSTILSLKSYDSLQSLHYNRKWTGSATASGRVRRGGVREGLCVQWSGLKPVRRGWWIYWKCKKAPPKEEHNIKYPVMSTNTPGFTKSTAWRLAKPRFKRRHSCSLSLKFSWASLAYGMRSVLTSGYIQKQRINDQMCSDLFKKETDKIDLELLILIWVVFLNPDVLALTFPSNISMSLIHLATPKEWKDEFPVGSI